MIQNFLTVLAKRGISKPALYKVEFTKIPQRLLSISGMNELLIDIPMFVETSEIPGTQVMTQDLRIYDMPAKYAYGKVHDDLNLTIRLDRDMLLKRFFDYWIDSIYDSETGNIHYKNTYVGTIQIFQAMENGTSSFGIELVDAFPIQIGQISLGWEQQTTYSRMNVTFSFRKIRRVANKQLFNSSNSNITNNAVGNAILSSLNNSNYSQTMQSVNTSISPIFNQQASAYQQINVLNKVGLSDLYSFNSFGVL